MSRLSRVVIVAGAAVAFAACSEMAPTAPTVVGDLVVAAATTSPSASCTVTQNGTSYDVTVTWSGYLLTGIELWRVGASQPLLQAVLAHPTRNGSRTFTLTTAAPDYAQLTGRQISAKILCSTVI